MRVTNSPVISIPRSAFDVMLRFARLMHRLKRQPSYVKALQARIASAANYDPGLPSVLMGYDFHLTPDGPRLIEINNNAGGLYQADGSWLQQPESNDMPGSLKQRLLSMFPETWQSIAIMDEEVESQFMYPEMCAYADLLRQQGRQVVIVSPEAIRLSDDGALYAGDVRLHAIYNRHTDFYLEGHALAHIRDAYLSGRVALTPNPRSYALLGDKSRMVDWWHPGMLEDCLQADDVCLVRETVPETRMLAEAGNEDAWAGRKSWVFKPAARHGGKGVILGRAMSRKRFGQMSPEQTVMQRYVPPSTVQVGEAEYKFDVRLFTHGEALVAVAGRIYQGMLTNFRTPGSGWVSLDTV